MTVFPITDSSFVESLLPQKKPFVMIDQLLKFSEKKVEAGLKIDPNNIFSHDGVFHEAGLIEHMAQTIAVHAGYGFFLKKEEVPIGFIGSISSLEIIRLPKYHENLETTAEILHEFGGMSMVEIEVKINGEKIAAGQMKTILL